MNDKDNLLEILRNNGDLNDVKPKSNIQLTELQLAELKDLREENKVLMQECDRLIKEKGELLSKVSGGDVLRICQLEEQLEKAKRLLKAAVDDFAVYGALKDLSSEQRVRNPDWRRFDRVFDVLDHQWRYADEALKLLNDEK